MKKSAEIDPCAEPRRAAEDAREARIKAEEVLANSEAHRRTLDDRLQAALADLQEMSQQVAEGAVSAADERIGQLGSAVAALRAQIEALDEHALVICRERTTFARSAETTANAELKRWQVYATARQASEEAQDLLKRDYPELAVRLAGLGRTVLEAQRVVILANQALPEGCGPLADPEAQLRDLPAQPSIVVDEVEEERSVFEDDLQLVPDSDGQRHRFSGRQDAASWRHAGGQKPVRKIVKRPFRVRRILSGIPAIPGPRLRDLVLPALKAGEMPYQGEDASANSLPQRFERVEVTPFFDAPERGLVWSHSTHRWVTK